MMQIYKRGRTWWMTYTDEVGARKRRSTRCRDRNAANIVAAEVLRTVELRRAGVKVADPAAAAEPIAAVIRDYCASLDQRSRHAAMVRYRLDRAVRQMRCKVITDITPPRVIEHLDALEWRGRAAKPRTRNQVRQVIHAFCVWAMRQSPPLLAVNPIDAVPLVAETRDPARWPLMHAEAEALLAAPEPANAFSRSRWPLRRLAYMLALDAGLRRGDAKHLTASRVRLDGLLPFVELPSERTKSRRFEQVPLTRRLAEALRERVTEIEPEDLVLPSVPGPEVLRSDLRRAGVDPTNPTGLDVDYHTLRHTFVAELFRRGASARDVQRLARHSDVATTMKIYAQVGGGEAADAIRLLENVTPSVTAPVPDCACSVPRWAQLDQDVVRGASAG